MNRSISTAGAKLTGRVGRLSFGLLDAQAERYFHESRGKRVGSRNLGVARMTYDVGEESRIGAIVTNGDPQRHANNTLVGADALLRTSRLFGSDRQLEQRMWIQHSESGGTSEDQLAWGTRLAYPNDRLNWAVEYRDLQKNFHPALGRAPRPGTRMYSGHVRLRHRPEGVSRWRYLDVEVNGNAFTDQSANEQSRAINAVLAIESRFGDRAQLQWNHRFDRIEAGGFAIRSGVTILPGRYSYGGPSIFLQSSTARPWSGSLAVGGGDFYGGTRIDVVPTLSWRPNRHWWFELRGRTAEVDLPEGKFSARIASVRLQWQPSPDVVWSLLAQWRNDTDEIGVQSRLHWIVVPGREFFLVLSQDILDIDEDVRRGRSAAIGKLGWTFRF